MVRNHCAECPGIAVRFTPESLCGMPQILHQKLNEASDELNRTRKELEKIKVANNFERIDSLPNRVSGYFRGSFPNIEKLIENRNDRSAFTSIFNRLINDASTTWINDAKRIGWVDDDNKLTTEGFFNFRKAI